MSLRGDVLWLNPRLPDEIDYLSMLVSYRDHSLRVEIVPENMTIKAIKVSANPIKIGFDGKVHSLKPGKTLELKI